MKKRYITITLLVLIAIIINSLINNQVRNEVNCEPTTIYIENVIQKNIQNRYSKINERENVEAVINLINTNVQINKNNMVNKNYGYIEIYHICDNDKIILATVIYTVDNGIIILSKNGEYHRNNDLRLLIEDQLNIRFKYTSDSYKIESM